MPGYITVGHRFDERAIVWPKLQLLKAKHLEELEQLHYLMSVFDTRRLSAESALKLNCYKGVVIRLLTCLHVTRDRLPLEFNLTLLENFAQQLKMVIDTFKRKSATEISFPRAGT